MTLSRSPRDTAPEGRDLDASIRPQRSRRSVCLLTTTLALCGISVSLQQSLLLPLVSDLPRLLDTSVDDASWIITATLLTGTVAIPIVSRLADMYGKKRLLLVTLGVLALGSALGAVTSSVPLLICARSLQGVGLALVPVGIAVMRDELPHDRVSMGVALLGASIAIGAGVGLPLSGVISEHFDWHTVFYVTAVIGVLLFAAIWFVVDESPVRAGGRFDYTGAVVLSIALLACMLALSKGETWGWTSTTTLVLAAFGVVTLVIWVCWETRIDGPLIDVRVAARPTVLVVNLASLLLGFGQFLNLLMTSLLLHLPTSAEMGFGLSVMETGLWMAPVALAFGAAAPFAAAMTKARGPGFSLVAGAAVIVTAFVLRCFFHQELWQVLVGATAAAVGTSMTYAAMPILIMWSMPVTQSASANGLNTLIRYLGTSTSSAVVAAVTAASATSVHSGPSERAIVGLFLAAAAAAGVAGLAALTTLSKKPAHPADAADDPAAAAATSIT
ncbi:MFS transporter [Dactylosporangium sp. NPDC051484]|uniref:MFS transporter n=1 Tax=Dactylosporangium sp. NPDC051484 TaxID=3154942 RepID=UPI00344E9210